MRILLRWLLGLTDDRWADGGRLGLRFASPPAPWIMLAGAVLAALLLHVLLRRETLTPSWRRVIYALRLCAVLMVLFILGQPMLVLRRTNIDRSRVVVLLDQSASMSFHDERSEGHSNGIRRWDAAVRQLTEPQSGLLGPLLEKHDVDVWTFGETADLVMSMSSQDDQTVLQGRLSRIMPIGNKTNLAGALESVLERTRGLPLSAILVIGDGRETGSTSVESALSRARARSAAVHAIGAGSADRLKDIELLAADCEEDVFVRDSVAIRMTLGMRGYLGTTVLDLQARDKVTGERVAQKRVTLVDPDDPSQRHQESTTHRADPAVGVSTRTVELVYRPDEAGTRVLIVSAIPREDEANVENNTAEVVVRARDEKIGVLYVEGSPRFEYRYLKNMLLREPSIDSSCLLLSATPGFPQEGSRPIRQFPRSVEELRAYDVIVLGDVDVRSDWLSPVQQMMLSEHVMLHGAGIVFVAGERHMPLTLRQTPLEKLLPVRIDPSFTGVSEQTLTEGFEPMLTRAGIRSGFFSLHDDNVDEAESSSVAAHFYWFARVLGAQPACEVLAVHPVSSTGLEAMPLAVMGRVGAGRTFYLGSDDAWRLRQTAGEPAYEAFWLRVIRTLARGRKLGNECGWRLSVDRRQCEIGESVRMELVDENRATSGNGAAQIVTIVEAVRGFVGRQELTPVSGAVGRYEGVFESREHGNYQFTAQVIEELSGCRKPATRVSVVSTGRERRTTEADHEYLKNLASRNGGSFHRIGLRDADFISSIPDRSVQIPDDVEETLWDKPLMLCLFAPLVIVEWIIRKKLGLV